MLLQKCTQLFFLLHFVTALPRIDPLVETKVGLIKGLRADDEDYSMFLGIPFAQVDENNPFGAASPYPKFEGTFEAHDDSVVCPQVEEFNNTIVGSLDCLNLNIFVPQSASSTNRLPVLVWIYGGGFQIGFGNRYLYGPSYLVRHDIILVTVNYRIGPYGFMCLDIPEVPGNQGLKDQLLALRWIKNNIKAFGGDPDKVTIFGESAGAVSVDMHLVSNSEKLYDKAIVQSKYVSSLSPPVRNVPILLSEHLGYPTDNIYEALNFLSKVNTDLVIAAVQELRISSFSSFRPCVEIEFEGVENIITQSWVTTDLPKVKNTPILIGFNNDEMYAFHANANDDYYKNLNPVRNQLRNGFDINSDDFEGMEDNVRHFYFGDEEMSAKLKKDVVDLESDFSYVHPTYRRINKYIDNEAGNIFLYVFSYVGKRNFVREKNNITSGDGALHADEISYLFDISYMKGKPVAPGDQQVIDQMTAMWANFVKYGNPTPQTSALLPVQWTPITNRLERPFLNIGSRLTLEARPFSKRAAFWDLFYKANERLQIV